MNTETTYPEGSVTLDAIICKGHHRYSVTFATEDQAITYVMARRSTHAFYNSEVNPLCNGWENLAEILYPTCEHGLSESLCAGPDHYPA